MTNTDKHFHNTAIPRRRFLAGAIAGAGALALDPQLALAEALVTGRGTQTPQVRGNGVPAGEIRLNNNENALGASLRVSEQVSRHLFEINRFSFTDDLVKYLANLHGITPGQANGPRVLLSPGTDLILHTVGVVAAGDGDGEVIEAVPAYGRVSSVVEDARLNGADTRAIRVPLTSSFIHDLEAMRRAVTPRTTCIVITNPNNPTGTIVPYDDLVQLVDSVPPHIMVLIDEAYIQFVTEPSYQDAMELARTRKNVIVTRTFSKMYGLAGLRIGYAVAHQDLIGRLTRLVQFSETLSTLSKAAAMAALTDDYFIQRTLHSVKQGKTYLSEELSKMNLSYIPGHTNFLMIDVKQDARWVRQALARHKVFVSSRPHESDLSTFMRVSIGQDEEMKGFVATLKKILS